MKATVIKPGFDGLAKARNRDKNFSRLWETVGYGIFSRIGGGSSLGPCKGRSYAARSAGFRDFVAIGTALAVALPSKMAPFVSIGGKRAPRLSLLPYILPDSVEEGFEGGGVA